MHFERSEEQYIFTIIMAVYNVEEYLEEAIQSVINQTLDFGKHVQLILVNDGSPDNSEHLCLRYSEEYPNNIFYISKENGGVSSARNEGLKYAEGKYINFLDPDDKLSLTTLEEVFKFFELHYDEVDVVSIPITFFEARTGPHPLNYKFAKARVVDLDVDYNHIQLSAASSFFKNRCLKLNKFKTNISLGEDLELLSRILIQKLRLGVVSEGCYLYRKRHNGGSAIQMSTINKDWYLGNLEKVYMYLIEFSIVELGYVHKYIQYIVMYEMQWRLKVGDLTNILNNEEYGLLLSKLQKLLGFIEDSIIFEQKFINMHLKMFALSLKHPEFNSLLKKVFFKDDISLYYKEKLIDSLKKQSVYIEFINYKDNYLEIEGFFGSLFNNDDYGVLVNAGGQFFTMTKIDRKLHGHYSLSKIVKDYKGFTFKLPFNPIKDKEFKIKFFISIENHRVPVGIEFRKFAKMDKEVNKSHTISKKVSVSYDNQYLIIRKNSIMDSIKSEISLYKSIKNVNGINSVKIMLARLATYIIKFISRKEIWLFMDRLDKADDNAEHLYRYSLSQKDSVKKFFIINKNSQDFNRIRKYGIPVSAGSFRHKILSLVSSKVISSHAEEWITNPFFGMKRYYMDLMNFDFVFLQHGIIQGDFSQWLNKYNKNIKLFITSSYQEHRSIIEGNYSYGSDVIKMTGLPRYDNLIDRKKRQIIIMPTWRKNLVGILNQKTGARDYSHKFKESLYFKFYNQLINDERLIDAAREHNYKIVFFPHPNISHQLVDFEKNYYVSFGNENNSYQSLFNESSLLITDFSSVAFDFAYLKKPVIYYHFEEYPLESGYFNYEEMGFGEICNEHEILIDTIICYIENQCQMKDIYKQRVDQFYAYNDRSNSERVYNEIIKLGN